MKNTGTHLTTIAMLLACLIPLMSACNTNIEHALEQAGGNRTELEKVLEHFKDDPDHLKYEAAMFLIENMPYHHTQVGKGADKADSAYLAMAMYPLEQREKVFKQLAANSNSSEDHVATDIKTAKAEYLIRAIDEACDLWREVAWNNEYSNDLFFDYVLPYRLLDEPLSDWRTTVKQRFPSLFQNRVFSKRGYNLKADTLELTDCAAYETTGAAYNKYVLLDHEGASISFHLDVAYDCCKNVTFRYATTKRNARLSLAVNGQHADTLRLAPTNSFESFRPSRTGYGLQLKKGINKICVSFAGDTIGLDYVQIGAIEPFDEKTMDDYSQSYCIIKNMQNGSCITFDTLQTSLLDLMEVKPFQKGDSTQMVRMDYMGRACWRISAFKNDTIDLCMETQYASLEAGAPLSQYKYINGNNQRWVILPIGNGLSRIMSKDTGLFLDLKKDTKTGKAHIVQNPYRGEKSQQWKIERMGANPHANSKYSIGSIYSEALRVHELMAQFEWVYFSTGISPKTSSLMKARTGNCRDEASYTAFLCRSLGIPATIDFTPHWGNRSWGHQWSVLIKPDGKAVPFYMGSTPGDTAQFFHGYVKAKVFRHRFQLNRQIKEDMVKETSIPKLFHAPDWVDVTNEYCPTTDVTRDVPNRYRDKKIAYICIFDNNDWMPVYYGVVANGKVTFPNMGRQVMYISAFCENGRMIPFGSPFCIKGDGTVRSIRTDKSKCTMHLTRKYPFFSANEPFNYRMRRGRFQGANTSDFSKATDLLCFNEVTKGNWYEFPVTNRGAYRYLRYMSPDGSFGNINELWFFDEKGDTIKGDIIGNEGNAPESKNNVFDNNILTGFDSSSPDGNWVGLRLKRPKRVSKIRFIPRTDGNCIEIGDKYELRVWTDGAWKVIATVRAKTDVLSMKNIQKDGLYLLKNITKGNEQRIFTYEDDKQVWW